MQNELKEIKFLNENEELFEMPILTYFMPKIPHILPNSEEQLHLVFSDRTNNFLTTAFSIIAKYPQLIFSRFNTETIQANNNYHIDMNLLGELLPMEVPGEVVLCRNSPKCKIDPLFTQHTNTFFFTYLLEKARSLLYNSYLTNVIGNPFEVVQEIFGGFYRVYQLKDNMKVLSSLFSDKYYKNVNDLNKLTGGSYFIYDTQNFEKRAILIKDIISIDNYNLFLENKQKRIQNYSFEVIDVKTLDEEHDTKKFILNLKINSLKEYKYLIEIANIKNTMGFVDNENNGKEKGQQSNSKIPSMNDFRDNIDKDKHFPSSIMVDYNKIKNAFKYFSINYFRPPLSKKEKTEDSAKSLSDQEIYNDNNNDRALIFTPDNSNNSQTFSFMGKIDDHVHFRIFTFEITQYSSVYVNVMEKSFMYFIKYTKKHIYNDVRITVFGLHPTNSDVRPQKNDPSSFSPLILCSSDKFDEKVPIKSFETHLKPGYYAVAIEIQIKNDFPAYTINFELNEQNFKSFNYIGDLYAYDLMFLYSYINSDKNFFDKLNFVDIIHNNTNKKLDEERKLMLQAIKENISKKNPKIIDKSSSFVDKDSSVSYGYTSISKNLYLLYFEKSNQYKKVGVKINKKVFKRFNLFFSYNLFESYDINLKDNCTFFLSNKMPLTIFILKVYDEKINDQVLDAFVKRTRGYSDSDNKAEKNDVDNIKDDDDLNINPKYIKYKTKGYSKKSNDKKDLSKIVNEELNTIQQEPVRNNYIDKNVKKVDNKSIDINAYRRGGTKDSALLINMNKAKIQINIKEPQKMSQVQGKQPKKLVKKVSFDFSKRAEDLSNQRLSESAYDPYKKPSKSILANRKSKFDTKKNNELTANYNGEKSNLYNSKISMGTRDDRYSHRFFNMLINQSHISKNLFYHNHKHIKIDIRNQFFKYAYFNNSTSSNITNKNENSHFLKFDDQRPVKELTDEESIELCKKYGTKVQKTKGSECTNIKEYYTGNDNFVLIYIENQEPCLILREERYFSLNNLHLEPNKMFLFMQNNQVFYEVWPNTSILIKLNIVYKHKGYKFDFDVAYDLLNI